MDLIENVFSRGPLSSDSPTSAERLVLAMNKRGIQRDSITSGNLMAIYRQLQQRPNRPDFSFIEKTQLERASTDVNADPLWCVIVETRAHPALEFVITNFANRSKARIQLFHGPGARDFILSTSIRPLVSRGQVVLTSLGVDRLKLSEYNALLLSEDFWHAIHATRKVLIFQTDTVLCKQSHYTIDDFMDYDYIGSNWNRVRPTGLVMDGGNGGLSLRSKPETLKCLKRFPPEFWVGGEDGYYAFHFDIMGVRIGREDACARFSTQNEFTHPSLGAHNISRLNETDLHRFLQYCPEAYNILR